VKTPRTLLERFGFDAASLRLLKRTPNRVYRVRSSVGDALILRFRDRDALTPAAALTQQRWLDGIARQTDVVAPVVVPLSGKLTQIVESQQLAMFTWVEGRRVAGPDAFLKLPRLTAVAETVAKLHRHAQTFSVEKNTGIRRFDADYFFATDYSSLARRDRTLLARLARRARDAMHDLRESRRRFGLIHGDLGPANWVFHRGDARPIDFDEFGVGYFLFDFVQVLWTHSMWRDYDDHMSRLVASYERVRPLDGVERRHLQLFQALPQVDWITRTLRAGDTATLKRWLPQAIACVRRCTETAPVRAASSCGPAA
jgi:Ser/Thr protein kinase RdoA (MazF antagonist)